MSDELKSLFREGAMEYLGELEEAILKLGENPSDSGEIDRLFRVMHTIKGSAGMVGLEDVSAFAHQLESEFDLIRQGKSEFSPAMLDIALLARDQMMTMIDAHFDGSPADPECTTKIIAEIRKNQKHVSSSVVQANQDLLAKQVAELPKLMVSPETRSEASEALHKVLVLAKQQNIQCLVEFLREFQEDFEEAARLYRSFPPEALPIAESAGHEAISILSDAINPPSADMDPLKIMEALERPLSIQAAWREIRPRFADMPVEAGKPRTFKILIPCPEGQMPSGISADQLIEKLKPLGQIRLIHRPNPGNTSSPPDPSGPREHEKGVAA